MTIPTTTPVPFEVWTDGLGVQRYLHGTKGDLKPGDLIEAGRTSNYGARKNAAFVYLHRHAGCRHLGRRAGDG